MPKERRDCSEPRDRCRASPFKCETSRHTTRSSPKSPLEIDDYFKEWEDARCPVCMEHPHNAVLLICSSHDNGCRPYMCDTSHRHSNCLDQFRKSFAESSSTMPGDENIQLLSEDRALALPSELFVDNMSEQRTQEMHVAQPSELFVDNMSEQRTQEMHVTQPSELFVDNMSEQRTQEMRVAANRILCENLAQPKLLCPLCRGKIKKWIVNEPARLFMNAKLRSCSCETCSFSGTYTDLRKHARQEHPQVRPSEADPERQRIWRRMERQRDLRDLLSTLQSSFGDDRFDDSILPIDDGGLLTVFFLFRVIRPESSARSSSWSGTSRARAPASIRRRSPRLWGESYNEETESSSRDEDHDHSDDDLGHRSHPLHNRQTTPDNLP